MGTRRHPEPERPPGLWKLRFHRAIGRTRMAAHRIRRDVRVQLSDARYFGRVISRQVLSALHIERKSTRPSRVESVVEEEVINFLPSTGTAMSGAESLLQLPADEHLAPTPKQQRSKLVLPPLNEEVSSAKNIVGEPLPAPGPQPESKLLPLPPLPDRQPTKIDFAPSARTRLAPDSELEEQAETPPRTGWLRFYFNFYYQCPSCRSEEVYALNPDGRFTTQLSERSWIWQRMFCERCICMYHRPGRLFLGPAPGVRPADSKLYDD